MCNAYFYMDITTILEDDSNTNLSIIATNAL